MNPIDVLPDRINRVLVLGGGSAGFLAAITLKKRLPGLEVRVLRSKELGIIGVGEGTTSSVPFHLFRFLKLDLAEFYAVAQPLWKLGIRFEWGPRPYFHYVFGLELDVRYKGMTKGVGHYLDDGPFEHTGMASALMSGNKAFYRRGDGTPHLDAERMALHIENEQFVAWLEGVAARMDIQVQDDTVVEVLQDARGVSGLRLASGPTLTADLFIDCSGFHAVLLDKALKEPYRGFRKALFCDRAVVGGWNRTSEPIKPYTTAESMQHGWCWAIEHETRINRGYVYSSPFVSDSDAEMEFRTKNPRVERTRIVKFNSGCFGRNWVGNVVGIGNAAGFVEPLEATALATICIQAEALAETLLDTGCRPTPALIELFNRRGQLGWDSVRDFLAVHYKFNTRFDTPYWRHCQDKTDLGAAQEIVDYYRENGPSGLWRVPLYEGGNYLAWGMEGYFAMLVGMKVPYQRTYAPTAAELDLWQRIQQQYAREAQNAFSVREALDLIRSPQWKWPADLYANPQTVGLRRSA